MRVGKADGEHWLRLSDAARALGVSQNTLRRWSDAGTLTCYRSPGGHRRYRRTDVDRLLAVQTGSTGIPEASADAVAIREPGREQAWDSLSALCRIAVDTLAVDCCRFLLRSGNGTFTLAGEHDPSGLGTPEEAGCDVWVATEVLRSRRRIIVGDIDESTLLPSAAAAHYRERGVRALLALPLRHEPDPAGIAELTASGRRTFTAAEIGFAEFLAREACLLLAGGEGRGATGVLPPEVVRQAADGEGSASAENGLAAPHDLLRTLAQRLCAEPGVLACDISRYDPAERVLHVVASAPVRLAPSSAGLVVPEGRLSDVLEHEPRPVCLDAGDATMSPRQKTRVAHTGAGAVVCAPLRVSEHPVGLLELFLADGRPLEPKQAALLEASAAVAALALTQEDMALAGHVARLNELIEGLASDTAMSDAEALLQSTLDSFTGNHGVSSSTIYRPEEGVLRPAAWSPTVGRPRPEPILVADLAAAQRALQGDHALMEAADAGPAESLFLRARGHAAALFQPLTYRGQVVALLEIGADGLDSLRRWQAVVTVLADGLAAVLGTGAVIDQLQRRNRDLSLVFEAVLQDTTHLTTREVLRTVAKRLAELTCSPVADIYAVDGDTLRALVSYDGGRLDDEWEGVVLPLPRYPCSLRAVETGEVVIASSLDEPFLSAGGRYSLEKWGYQAQLSLPLISAGRVLGLVELSDYVPRDFAADVELVRGLGHVAAQSLENATLMEQVERRSRILNELVDLGATANKSRDLDALLRQMAVRVLTVVDAANCDVLRLDDDGLRCVVSYDRSGFDDGQVGALLDRDAYPTLVNAMNAHKVLTVDGPDDPQLTERERGIYREHGVASEVCIPLIVNERLRGAVDIYDTRRRDYTEYLSFLQSAGQIMAGAMENMLLLGRLEGRTSLLRDIVELGAVTSQTRDLQELLKTIAVRLRDTVQAADCDMFALQGDQLRCLVSADRSGLDGAVVGEVLAVDRFPATAMALHTGEPMIVASLEDPRLSDFERDNFARYGFESELCIPLVVGERVIGLIDIFDTRPREYEGFLDYLRSVGQMAAGAIENARMYGDIKHMHLSNLKALSSALNAKDYYTLGHAARVAAYMVLLGEELGWPVALLRQMEEAAYLHDIGKIGVSDRVLLKPSSLNQREWELMRQHPIFSADIIRSLFSDELVLGVRHHHERYEGGGYPDGVAGEEIPLLARAMCVADSYDAMSFRRPYRLGLSYRECIDELRRCRAAQFDPDMVDAFLRVLDRLAGSRGRARQVAHEAARRVDPEAHARLRAPEDEALPEYSQILRSFREVCRANPPTRYITSHIRVGKKTVMVVDSNDGPDKPHVGDEALADDELLEVFAGRDVDTNVLLVDQWGVWISGSAPLRDEDGRIVAAVTADLPAIEHIGEIEGLSNVAQTFASMLQTAAVQAGRSEVEAITDGLTGLYNHRYFHERLSEEVDRCLSQDGSVSLLFCDIDNFRAFNELHGHSAGDQALRTVARVIETSVRHVDIAARFGGEEFAAILIDTDVQAALEVAERIRAGIVQAKVAPADSLSISIGVASCPSDATFKEELIDKADWAMYLAKRRGRDQVMSFSERHGTATPEQAASVTSTYVDAMSELVAARDAYERRKRFAVAHLAQAVAVELGLDARDMASMAAAAETATPQTLTGLPRMVVEAAAAFQALVADRPYREQLSEAESLTELLVNPVLRGDPKVAAAFERVLSGEVRTR